MATTHFLTLEDMKMMNSAWEVHYDLELMEMMTSAWEVNYDLELTTPYRAPKLTAFTSSTVNTVPYTDTIDDDIASDEVNINSTESNSADTIGDDIASDEVNINSTESNSASGLVKNNKTGKTSAHGKKNKNKKKKYKNTKHKH